MRRRSSWVSCLGCREMQPVPSFAALHAAHAAYLATGWTVSWRTVGMFFASKGSESYHVFVR